MGSLFSKTEPVPPPGTPVQIGQTGETTLSPNKVEGGSKRKIKPSKKTNKKKRKSIKK